MRRVLSTIAGCLCFPAAIIGQVEIECSRTPSPDDDYLGWYPSPLRLRVTDDIARTVTLSSEVVEGKPEGGKLVFQEGSAEFPSSEDYDPKDTLRISLPANGTWVNLWVSGKFRHPSFGSKDVEIVVASEEDDTLETLPVMVRVRKNAEKLNATERDLFLEAIRRINRDTLQYSKYPDIHRNAFSHPNVVAHRNPGFLTWHRAFILDFERALQEHYPEVALPYWFFQESAPKIFSRDFMGEIDSNAVARMSATNPLRHFRYGGSSSLIRHQEFSETALHPEPYFHKAIESDSYSETSFPNTERYYHNNAHSLLGTPGATITMEDSPGDPIFFLLHAEVDRTFAFWQHMRQKFQPSDYEPIGAHQPGNRFTRGVYAEDKLWPWSESSFPPSKDPNLGPSAQPQCRDMMDYMGSRSGKPFGFCYDDIDYRR